MENLFSSYNSIESNVRVGLCKKISSEIINYLKETKKYSDENIMDFFLDVLNISLRLVSLLLKLGSTKLGLNFLWSILFFYLQSPTLGFINILLLDIALLLYMKRCYDIRKVAFWLNVPYMLWLIFATYLNLYVMVYN